MASKPGRGLRHVHLRLGTIGSGVATPDQADGFAEAMFEVIDNSVPYIIPRRAPTDRLPVVAVDRGTWADLRPDRLVRDARGGLAFFPGHGAVRARLARAGITRAQWESLSRARRLTVIDATFAMIHAERAISSLVKHANPSVTLKAQTFLESYAKIAKDEYRGERGFRHEIERTAAFRKGKRLVARLLPELERVQEEGERRRSDTFSDVGWRKRMAETVSEAVAGRRDWPCEPSDIAKLVNSPPLAVARLISSRVHDISKDLLRWEKYRSRAEPRRKARGARETAKISIKELANKSRKEKSGG